VLVEAHSEFSLVGLGRPLSILAALSCCALAGCSEGPTTLRIVSGPPAANEQVAALLASASEEAATPVRIAPGPKVAGAEGALTALADGRADLAIVENSAGYRFPAVRTVAPLYPSVLHIGVRPEKRGQTLAEVLQGARVFAGGEQTAARQLLNRMAQMYAWSGIEVTFVDSPESNPDVVFVFAPVSPSAAPMLEGYELLSLGSADHVGSTSAADALALVAPFLRSFVIPEGTYGPLTPTPVATVAVDTLLVARAETPIVAIYDLIESIQMMGPLLVAQRPDLAIDELETFEISHVTFPVHAGTMALRARNDPGFAERAGSIFDMAITIVVALFTALFALVRFVRGLRKGRIDRFYNSVLEIRRKLAEERSLERRLAYVTELRALRADAFSMLINEKLAADDSFRILQALLFDVIREAETPFGEPPAAAGSAH
jgi:TRAP-type uncharacterized transport system substrate-binding protein